MNKTLLAVVESLDDLEASIISAYSGDETMADTWGWHCPPLTRHDLAELASNLSQKITSANIQDIDKDQEDLLEFIPERIENFKSQNLPYLFNGNGKDAAPNYFSLIEWISSTLEPLFTWEVMQDNKALPKDLARRLRSIQSELTALIPDKEDLKSQIDLIQKATEAAETLPTDLENLKEARGKVDKFSTDSAEQFGKIGTYLNQIEKISKEILNKKEEADKLVSQCEEAYKITTTKGLAAAFDLRANKLSNSMSLWVIGLLSSLAAAMWIGYLRFEIINKALEAKNNSEHIWIQVSLSVISLGAPIWFAWIATKQISQRFKLSEDYAFKASVAKAYEGYRKEAARIDTNLEKRLFTSALSRLEEAPLRLMEKEHFGSPWHEFISSSQFQDAMKSIPGFKDKVLSLGKKSKLEDNIPKE
ncbi:hypothetical protein [Flavobacterium sp. 3HN19-14]|uniref:hypothetical protein n=1 Tax=Flavobacterium sp. 3HN19-14 TaxID=3448133 RepID=UPI003EDF76DB